MSIFYDGYKEKFSFPDKKAFRIFISTINSSLGHSIVETLRNDYIDDEVHHLFIGTLDKSEDNAVPNGVEKIIDSSNVITLARVLLDCDIIIYDLFRCQLDEVEAAIKILKFSNFSSEKLFICVSTVMTWALSNIKDDFVLEDHLNMRKTYPKYQFMKSIEDQIIQLKGWKNNLKAYVLCAGIEYGKGEDVFFNFFKQAWLLEPYELQFFSDGKNIIPTIHSFDLAQYVYHTIHRLPEQNYIFAIDMAENQDQKSIVLEISKTFGSGLAKPKPTMEAVLDENFEICRIHLKVKGEKIFEPKRIERTVMKEIREKGENDNEEAEIKKIEEIEVTYEDDQIPFKWHCKEGFVKNIAKVCEEFVIYRGLRSNKILILGPPGVGKTYFGSMVAKFYNIPHIVINEVIEMILKTENELGQEVRKVLKEMKDKMIEEEQAKIELDKKKNKNKKGYVEPVLDTEKLNPRIPEPLLIKIYEWRLSMNDCRFRGYLLDGFPKSFDQSYALFVKNGSKIIYNEDIIREKVERKQTKNLPKNSFDEERIRNLEIKREIFPDSVIYIQASDDHLKEKIKNLPENIKTTTHFNEEGIFRRLLNYKKLNEEGGRTVLDFFKEAKFDFKELNGERMEGIDIDIREFVERNGAFKTYTNKEREYELERERELAEERENAIKLERKKKREAEEKEEAEKLEQTKKEEATRIEALRLAETSILDVRSQHLRQYLADRVIPFLTEGLIQLCKTGAENPLDFLADFLINKSDELETEMLKANCKLKLDTEEDKEK